MLGPSEALDSLSQNLGRSSQRESLQQRLGLFSAFFNKWQVVDGSKKSSTLVYHSTSVQSHTYRDSILWLSLLLLSNGIHCFFWSCFLLLFLLLVNQNHNHRCVQMLRLQRALRRLAFVSLFGAMLQPMLSCRPVGHLGIGEIKFVTWMSRAKWAELQFLWLRFLWLSCGWPPFRRPKPSWRMSKVLWQHPEFWPCTCQSEGKQKNCFGVPKIGRPGEAVLNFKWRFMMFFFEACFGKISNIFYVSSVCYEHLKHWDVMFVWISVGFSCFQVGPKMARSVGAKGRTAGLGVQETRKTTKGSHRIGWCPAAIHPEKLSLHSYKRGMQIVLCIGQQHFGYGYRLGETINGGKWIEHSSSLPWNGAKRRETLWFWD